MQTIKSSEIKKKLAPHPALKDLPDDLKDSKRFLPIEKKIDRIMYSDHNHATMKGFIKCKRCQEKFQKKRDYLHELGFKGVEEYQTWKKIMAIIHNKKDFQVQ